MEVVPSLSSVCSIMAIGIALSVIVNVTKSSSTYMSSSATGLPLPNGPKDKEPWYIDWNRFDATTFSKEAMKVTYQRGKFGGSSGAAFRARPLRNFPRDTAIVGCSVFVPSDFDFTRGGKLGPGLCIGKDIGTCATGGDHMNAAGSARISFSEDGEAVAYLYVPEQADAVHNRTGDKVLRSSKLRKDAWNTVSIGVALGRPGQEGSVTLTVNGSTKSTSLKWRTSSAVQISGLLFTTFFGGSDSSYAPKSTQTLSYKNFWISG